MMALKDLLTIDENHYHMAQRKNQPTNLPACCFCLLLRIKLIFNLLFHSYIQAY